MIEGLRLLPHFQEAARRGVLSFPSDCETCMDRLPANSRRLIACGHLPPHALGHAWSGCGYEGPDPTVCPGYSASLPEVAEANRAHFHWSKGNLIALHREPSDALMRCVEVLEVARGAATSWAMTPRSKGGGLDGDR